MTTSYTLGVDISGAARVISALTGFESRLTEGLQRVVRSTLIEGTTLAQQYAPVKTGQLSGSIRWELDSDGLGGWYGPDPANVVAWVQEKGSDPYEIRPKNAQALRFQIGGKTIFAKRVQHPGVTGSFYLQRSRDAVSGELQRETAQAVRDAVNMSGGISS